MRSAPGGDEGWMDCAFVAIVPTRPCPLFGRPVHRRDGSHRLRPGASPSDSTSRWTPWPPWPWPPGPARRYPRLRIDPQPGELLLVRVQARRRSEAECPRKLYVASRVRRDDAGLGRRLWSMTTSVPPPLSGSPTIEPREPRARPPHLPHRSGLPGCRPKRRGSRGLEQRQHGLSDPSQARLEREPAPPISRLYTACRS
jgi:hypothetical protein